MSLEFRANEADVAEQRRDLREDAEPENKAPSAEVEADPADVQEQSRAVPSEEDDWRDA
jgi:hypothetical protein